MLRALRLNPLRNSSVPLVWNAFLFSPGIVGEDRLRHISYRIHEGPVRLEVTTHRKNCEARDEYVDTDGACNCPSVFAGTFPTVREAFMEAERRNSRG